MPSRAGIDAGRAVFRFNADTDPYVRALKIAEARLKSFSQRARQIGTSFTRVGALITAPLLAASAVFAKTGDDVAKFARRTGVAVEAVQELSFAAQQSGADTKTLESAFRRQARAVNDLERGLSTQADAFGKIGLSIEDLRGLSPEEQFTLIADRLSQLEDATLKSAVAQQIFGRGGAQLIPLLDQGAAGIAALRDEARELGIVLSAEDAAAAEELTDAFGRVRSTFTALTQTIGAALAPALTTIANVTAAVVGGAREFIDQNRGLVTIIAAVGVGITVLGGIIVGIGLAAAAASVAMGGLATAIGAVGTVFAVVTSPITIVIALMLGLVGAVLYATGAIDTAVDAVSGAFADLKAQVGDTVLAIKDALLSGDFETAGELIGELFGVGLDLAKAKALGFLEDLKSAATTKAIETGTNIRLAWAQALASVMGLLTDFGAFIRSTWERITTSVAKIIGTIIAKFDPSITAADVVADLDAELGRNLGDIEKSRQDRRSQIERDQLDSINKINGQERNVLSFLEDSGASSRELIDSLETDALDRLKALQDRSRALIDAGRESDEPTERPELPDIPQLAADGIQRTLATFRAAEATQFGSQNVNEKIANRVDEISDTLKEIRDKPVGVVLS